MFWLGCGLISMKLLMMGMLSLVSCVGCLFGVCVMCCVLGSVDCCIYSVYSFVLFELLSSMMCWNFVVCRYCSLVVMLCSVNLCLSCRLLLIDCGDCD